MTKRLEISWKLDGFVDEQRYYCSETPININNLPIPKAILSGESRSYIDTEIEGGKNYFLIISSVKNSVEKLSDSLIVSTISHPVLSLFKNGEKGAWLDFVDITNVYQDVSGSIPITETMQPIKRVLDKSSNNNHAIAINEVSPIFTDQGAFFNGVGQILKTITQIDYGLSTNLEIFISIKSVDSSGLSYGLVFESGETYNIKTGSFVTLSPEANSAITAGFSISTNQSENIINMHKGVNPYYDGIYSIRITDYEFMLDVGVDGVYTKNKPSIPVSKNSLYIGGRVSNELLRYVGYIRHIVIVNRNLTTEERVNLISFLEESQGI